MKFELPEEHGLSDLALEHLVFKEDEQHSLSDAQFAALEAGVGRGESVLTVSPTSTGKTQIALWGLANGVETGCFTVYLVTHRALAKQKFEDFKSLLLPTLLKGDKSSLVIATGDYVEDAEGNLPRDPLSSRVLVATYEKYLALLSASGIPTDMTNTVVVCDEIQLLGDLHRGQNVEVLLTLLKNAGWKQFVGLSAVLEEKDSAMLANWLDVSLVVSHTREKHLSYECWDSNGIGVCNTANPDEIIENIPLPVGADLSPLSTVATLLKEPSPPVPIIVFCMKKQDTYDLAKSFVDNYLSPPQGQLSLAFEDFPETSASQFLSQVIEHRVGSHSADLTDEEREVVERRLIENKLDVVFATSTLAAGVNFPLGAAVFSDWKRWNANMRQYVPIDQAEFHNMSGRVGRMGFEHDMGRVIFFSRSPGDTFAARQYLNLGGLPSLESRITPSRFEQLSLQLIASGLCTSRDSLIHLICSTLSGLREQDNNNANFSTWPGTLQVAVSSLCQKGLLLETSGGNVIATPLGKAIAFSGLLPDTGINLLNYCIQKVQVLTTCLSNDEQSRDENKFTFLIVSSCFASPEFKAFNGQQPTRFLPWPLETQAIIDPSAHVDDLYESIWQADVSPTNGAKLTLDWISGTELRALEGSLPSLTAGMLNEMFRNLVWAMQGLSSIIMSATDSRVPVLNRPLALRNDEQLLKQLRQLPRAIRRLSYRIGEGLPDDILWMTSLSKIENVQNFRLSRIEILALRNLGYHSPEQLMLGTPEADQVRLTAFQKVKPIPHNKANWLRDACRNWKVSQRQKASERQIERASRYSLNQLFHNYYDKKGDEFEVAFEELLTTLGIQFEKLDDKTKTGAPDYLLKLLNSPEIVMELKSKQGGKLVDYNSSTEVLAASEIHGYGQSFCSTLCHPGVDPSVPPIIIACERLSVVESHDLGEALLRVGVGILTQEQLWQWLTTPGQALTDDIPYRDYSN
ncbi:DEAD/DEAH box helicase [Sessilibacter corallicola]|uniref:DEAD/DEAH box helicase n=1 Tax=Sessilibacter corallicola TaxID=2904075 RepID=UPI001E3BA1F8|nr:DEAD/DEAH box helicase [Sessilibacter corallicola]MCE2029387.1 DEAD/DEAH box helicase [Sessilibacter corallicola]